MTAPTAKAIISRLTAELSVAPRPEADCDGFKFGDPNASIDQIVVCRAPTAALLRDAGARPGTTLVIAREDPFYLEPAYFNGSIQNPWSTSLPQAEATHPVLAAKRAEMAAGRIVLYRLFARWDASRPRALADALATRIGITPTGGPDPAASFGDVRRETFADYARRIKGALQIKSLRATGAPRAGVSRVAIIPGLPNVPQVARALGDARVDVVIVGETCEWEATPYFQDVIASGRPVGMLLVGYGVSEEPGMSQVAAFVRGLAGPIPVHQAAGVDPAWIA